MRRHRAGSAEPGRRGSLDPGAQFAVRGCRRLSGIEGVLGSVRVYRAAFTSIEQTEPLQDAKITVAVVGTGGERALGQQVGAMLRTVAENVTPVILNGVGHFVPEEAPREVVQVVTDLTQTSK